MVIIKKKAPKCLILCFVVIWCMGRRTDAYKLDRISKNRLQDTSRNSSQTVEVPHELKEFISNLLIRLINSRIGSPENLKDLFGKGAQEISAIYEEHQHPSIQYGMKEPISRLMVNQITPSKKDSREIGADTLQDPINRRMGGPVPSSCRTKRRGRNCRYGCWRRMCRTICFPKYVTRCRKLVGWIYQLINEM